MRQNAIVNFNS